MIQRSLGSCGLKVSAVGLGCNNFGMRMDLEASRAVIHKALDLGITLFDTADIYGNRGGSESILGEVLGPRRKNIILATKVGKEMDDAGTMKGASRSYILSSAESSLRRLKTDYIDLYQIHVPDPSIPIEETLRALDDLIRQGKVRYAGCSNFPAWKVVEAIWVSKHFGLNRFISCQDEYSLLFRNIERELIPAMKDYGLGLLPYFPLASGMLTDKYKKDEPPVQGTRFEFWKALVPRYFTEANWNIVERLKGFCAEHHRSLLELAFGWLLAKPVVSSVIAGATKPEQVEMNVNAANWTLSAEDLTAIDKCFL
jgi:aryl-alcohol dehydrogenase-like predicted oxidoreductase